MSAVGSVERGNLYSPFAKGVRGGFSALIRLFFLWAFSTTAFAADDLWSTYQLGVENDPIWQAEVAKTAATQTGVAQGWASLLPNVQWQGHANQQRQRSSGNSFLAQTSSSRFDGHDYTATLRQPLVRSESWVQLTQAYASSLQAEETLRAEKMNLMLRVVERYLGVLTAASQLTFAKAEKTAVQKQLADATARFEVGTAAITDTEEAKARMDMATAQVLEAQNVLYNAREHLKEVTGQETPELKKLKKVIPLAMPVPDDLQAWVAISTAQSPVIAAAKAALQSAQQEVWKIRSRHLPTLDALGSTTRSKAGGRYGDLKTHDDSIGLELTIPLFQGGGTVAKTEEAIYKKEAAAQGVVNATRTVESQLNQAYWGISSGISRIKALQQALVSGKKALEATQAGYEVGMRSMVDVLNAEREIFRTQKDLEQAKAQSVLNTLKLKQAAGTLLEDDLKQVATWFL